LWALSSLLAGGGEYHGTKWWVEGLKAGTKAFGVVTEDNSTFTVDVKDDIPIGHKVALIELADKDTVIKYGQDVGRMVASAAKGHHVHTQNMKTKRW